MPQKDTRLYFYLKILDTIPLCLGKYADIMLRLFDIGNGLWRDLGNAFLDLRVRELETWLWRPLVELLRVRTYGGVAFGADGGDDGGDNVGDFLGGGEAGGCAHRGGFQVTGNHFGVIFLVLGWSS